MTNRQEQIVSGLARGLQYKEIAHELGMATGTVSTMLWRLRLIHGVEKSNQLPGEIEFKSWRVNDPA